MIDNSSVKKNKKTKTTKIEESYKLRSSNKSEEDNNYSSEQFNEEEIEDEKKEGLPSLIIDVNIRLGVKKRYMYMMETLLKI